MIIADTGFWVALLDRRDNLHQKARVCAAQIHEPLITTLPVITEVCYLLQTRCGPKLSVEFLLAQQEGLFQILSLIAMQEVKTMMRQYSIAERLIF